MVPEKQEKSISRDFTAFLTASASGGAKAAGLRLVPTHWTPTYKVIDTSLYIEWLKTGALSGKILDEISCWANDNNFVSVIVRSSGATERICDRGKFLSEIISDVKIKDNFSNAIKKIFKNAKEVEASEKMGLVIQQYMKPDIRGHLSNEMRLSPSRNQWKYETEAPFIPMKGLNSKFVASPNPEEPIFCGKKVPHQTLRALGKWLSERIKPRCHIEWVTHVGQFFVVQLDIEWPEQDRGIDPTVSKSVSLANPPDLEACRILSPYSIGESTDWKKLKNLSDFDFSNSMPGPRIYPLEAKRLVSETLTKRKRKELIAEVKALTSNHVVVRTDCKGDGGLIQQFNLPRTDTLSAEASINWAIDQVDILNTRGLDIKDIAFLFHAFIPAKASAWAYASLNSSTVMVDALWGLPDGLQVLPVDSYEVHVPKGKIIQTRSTFKPRFLQELDDGSWVYEDIVRIKSRSKVLKDDDLLEIAKRTHEISKKINEDAQIMWFSGIPKECALGRNLPWYRSREKLDPAPRESPRYKAYTVKKPSDLGNLPERRAMIKLSPEADLIRDDEFLQQIIDVAIKKRLPVELEGSILGHIYYRLTKSKVAVYLSNMPKYHRTRQRRTFGKIVRDRILENILSGGEAAAEATLDKSDEKHGLAGKLAEELEEFLIAENKDDQLAELADLLEVLIGMAHSVRADWNEVQELATQKRKTRGGFRERKVLLETSLPLPNGSSDIHTSDIRKMVKIDALGLLEVANDEFKIPLSRIINSIGRSNLHVRIPDSSETYSFKIKDGRLIVKQRTNDQIDLKHPEQGELFK